METPPTNAAKKRGRPGIDAAARPSVRVALRVSTRDYDALYERARRDRMTVSEVVRRAIQRPD